MTAHNELKIPANSISLASDNWRRLRPRPSTRSLSLDQKLDQYLAAASSLLLITVLVVAAIGYGTIRGGTLGVAFAAAGPQRVSSQSHSAGLPGVATPTALGPILALPPTDSVNIARFKIAGVSAEDGNQSTTSQNASSFIVRK